MNSFKISMDITVRNLNINAALSSMLRKDKLALSNNIISHGYKFTGLHRVLY